MRTTAIATALVVCVLVARFSRVATAAEGSQPVAARMRNIVLHMGKGVDLRIEDLRGRLTSRKNGPPVFDDVESYLVDVDYAKVAMSGQSLTSLMNNFVFASDDAPIKKVAVAIEGNELVQSGVLKKGLPVPFKMRATVTVQPDGRLRIHPTSLKAAGFVSKRVLDFFGLELEKLVDVKDAPGIAVDGDDLLLDAAQALPPPRMRGKPTRVTVANGLMNLQLGGPEARGIEPPTRAAQNYMYYKGGTLKFGKLTMEDADLLLMDADPKDPFDFSPERYNDQLVAGYSKNTRAHGLIVHMPDANDIAASQRANARNHAAVSDRVTAPER